VGETAVDDISGGGWVSSYTGEPLSREEMAEYGDNILKKLAPLLHGGVRVLEIGCASGISMYRVAPRVGLYYGTDLSSVIIEKNKKRVKEEGHRNIRLFCLAAHEVDQIEENHFDLVIINSVIQCFHGHNYLRKVMRKAVDLLGDTGYLFIGDIMDLERKDAMVRELIEYKPRDKEKNHTTKTDFSSELFVSRGFWTDLAAGWPEIRDIEFSQKIYTVENELTRFRYDMLMSINKKSPALKSYSKHKYQDDLGTLSTFGSERFHQEVPPGSPVYVIYTSGSTGRPRGVMIEHRGIANLNGFWAGEKELGVGKGDRILQFSNISFDASVSEIFMALLNGASLYLISRETIGDLYALERFFETYNITVVTLPPPAAVLMNPDGIRTLRILITAGSESNREIVSRWQTKCRYINAYGPTEFTICATWWEAPGTGEMDFPFRSIPIGKPILNSRIYILDHGNGLRPVGTAGELCVTGPGTAMGYLNNPELTAEKFDRDEKEAKNKQKFFGGSRGAILQKSPPGRRRHYRTGDLARWLPDGNIEFLGRIDYQVKIRGCRIELGEIQAQLLKHPAMIDAVVLLKEKTDGDKFLCAYIVFAGEMIEPVPIPDAAGLHDSIVFCANGNTAVDPQRQGRSKRITGTGSCCR
jgi:fengycin family lipopeptide synthetase D